MKINYVVIITLFCSRMLLVSRLFVTLPVLVWLKKLPILSCSYHTSYSVFTTLLHHGPNQIVWGPASEAPLTMMMTYSLFYWVLELWALKLASSIHIIIFQVRPIRLVGLVLFSDLLEPSLSLHHWDCSMWYLIS